MREWLCAQSLEIRRNLEREREYKACRPILILFCFFAFFLNECLAGTCAKQPDSEVNIKSKWWHQTSDGSYLYCGEDEKYGCSSTVTIYDGDKFYRCHVQTGIDSWRFISINDITDCKNSTDFSNRKSAIFNEYLVYYVPGSQDYIVKNNDDVCRLSKHEVQDKCIESYGSLNSEYKCVCPTDRPFDPKTLTCKKQEAQKEQNKQETVVSEKNPGSQCSSSDLAKITGAASGVYNAKGVCVLKECKPNLKEVVKNGVPQGWCSVPPKQEQTTNKDENVGNWWTLLVNSIK